MRSAWLIRTDLPNGTFSKVEFDPWKHTTSDPNDNVAPGSIRNDTGGESLCIGPAAGPIPPRIP
jgi:hypothetical protein